jgi:hypothetical protein
MVTGSKFHNRDLQIHVLGSDTQNLVGRRLCIPPYVIHRPTGCNWPAKFFLASHLALKIEDYCYVRGNFYTFNVASYHTFYTLLCRTAVDNFNKLIWISRKALLLHSSLQASPSFHLLRVQILHLTEVVLNSAVSLGVQQTAFSTHIIVIRK